MKKRIILCLISILLLFLPWSGWPGYTLLCAFVPLFLLQEELAGVKNKKGKSPRIWPYILITLMSWTALSVWWVGKAIWFAAPASFLVITFVIFVPFMIYHYVWKRAKRSLAYAVLISAWVGYEYIFLHGEITFPWLILGNGFANSVEAVQWYEYTGALGGSVWVWACNIAIFEAIRAWRERKSNRVWIRPAGWVLLPFMLSLIMYWSYSETEKPVQVQVIQPNFDPYEKFEELSFQEQTQIIIELAMQAPPNTDFFVAPETAIDERIGEDEIENNNYIRLLRYFLSEGYLDADIIIGATTSRYYRTESEASYTARTQEYLDFWYDIYNTALQVNRSEPVGVYHKSKLVAGAEMIPYGRQLPILKKLSVDLGGTSGQLGVDEERHIFTSNKGIPVGTVICWEAVFGEYTSEFVQKGAQALFIISNDAWWGNTAGHRQLFAFSRLRAIENRRSIARSANTGISGFIDQQGRIVSRTQWEERISLPGSINLNDKMTIYTRFGDMTGRICCLVFGLCILYFIAYRHRKKDHLVE